MFTTMKGCCGIGELINLSKDPNWSLVNLLYESEEDDDYYNGDDRLDYEPNIVVFTDALRLKHGDKLARLIRRQGLGSLKFSGYVQNANPGSSTNKVAIWTWKVNWQKTKDYTHKTKAYKEYQKGQEEDRSIW